MGQAKAKREAQRSAFIKQARGWMAPPTDWEHDLFEEILGLPGYEVQRAPAHQLEWMRMKPRECHQNCRFYEAESNGRFKQQCGWVFGPGEGLLILHSVVLDLQTGALGCITPTPGMPEKFAFIPDDKIEWVDDEDNNVRGALRSGHMIHPGVRENPERTIEEAAALIARLEAGEDPWSVMQNRMEPSPR